MTRSGACAVGAAGMLLLAACADNNVRELRDAGRTFNTNDAGPLLRSDASVASASDAAASVPPRTMPGVDAGPDVGADLWANRDSQQPVVLYLSADDSNSMASPAIARSMIHDQDAVPSSVLRTYEMLNYYNVSYPYPLADHVNVVPELGWHDHAAGELTLQIGVQARPRETPQARVITFVLDRSGSMAGLPIDREREVVRAIAHVLSAGDIVSWVEWNTARLVRLEGHVVSGPDDPMILSLATSLLADGGTDVDGGLRYGYEIAQQFYDPTRLNRVVLVSDGVANAGETSIDVIASHADDAQSDGIYLVGVGVGAGYNDTLMNAVTDAGRGAYVYIDSVEEAHAIFENRFAEVMDVGMLDVRVELTLPWYMAMREFHGEEYSVGDPTAVRPQSLAPGDAMVFHQTIAACDPGLLDMNDPVHVRATYVRPTGRVAAHDDVDTTMAALLGAEDVGLVRGNAIVAFAEALATIARVREQHPRAGDDVQRRVDEANEALTAALANPANADLQPLVNELAGVRRY